jgi:hypothetical protein
LYPPTSDGFSIVHDLHTSNEFSFYRTIVGKGSGKSYKVKLDIMPTTNNTITINRSSIEVLEKGQEELPYSEKQ